MRQRHLMASARTGAGRGSVLARVVLIFLVLLALYGVYRILRPFIAPIILALFLVTIFHPFYDRLKERVGGRDNLAAGLSVGSIFLIVVIPFLLFTGALVEQGIEVFAHIQEWVSSGQMQETFSAERYREFMERPQVGRISEFLDEHFTKDGEDKFNAVAWLTERSSKLANWFVKEVFLPLLSKSGFILMNFFIMFFIMFYTFRDGGRMLNYMMQMVPLSTSHERLIVDRIRYVSRAILLGILMTASVQAIIAMIGFKIVGVPALFWGVMLGLSSLIPIVGTALVWVPICLFLFISGNTGQGVFLLLWCVFLVGTVDNFLRPYLMQGRSGMSTIILFFALLGGIRLFGPIGILYGPLIFAVCAVLLYIYRVENSAVLTELRKR